MIDLKADTILKIVFLIVLIILLVYLVVKLMVMGETIEIMVNVNKTFI